MTTLRQESIRAQVLLITISAFAAGCSSSWVYTFQDADRRFERRPQPRLIFFKDHLDPASGRMETLLDESGVKSEMREMIRCMLVAQGAGNWNYVARYGVDRFPALVVVHPDGTYHALMGEHTGAEIVAFLRQSQPPGSPPKLAGATSGPANSNWMSDYQEALKRHQTQNRKLLLVYKWWSSEPSAEMLRRLQSPTVQRATGEMLVCVLDIDYPPNRQSASQYGTSTVPALVLLTPGKAPRVLNGLQKPDEILRFLQGS